MLIGMASLVCCSLTARDGLIFNDVAPITVSFKFSEYSGSYIGFLNTSDEILHNVTLSGVVGGNKVSVVVLETVPPHKTQMLREVDLLKTLDKLGIPHTGPISGITITCQHYSKPVAVNGWWDEGLRLQDSVREQYRK